MTNEKTQTIEVTAEVQGKPGPGGTPDQRIDAKAAELMKGPFGWIQFKGTNICMDVHCACGVHGHVDDYFAYYVKCAKCGAIYAVSGYVLLEPVSEQEIEGRCEPLLAE